MAQIKIEETELKNMVRQTVMEMLQAISEDSDFGLELREWVKKRLKKRPKKLISLEKIKKTYL